MEQVSGSNVRPSSRVKGRLGLLGCAFQSPVGPGIADMVLVIKSRESRKRAGSMADV